MDVETKLELIKRPPTEEIITEKELKELLETNEHPKHYIGFEISGLLHLGTLVVSGYKINDLAEAGVDVTVYLADWHSFINKKLGGNWDNILKAAKYFEEAFKFFCPKAKIVLGSDLYHNNDEYWKDIIRFSSNVTLNRVTRCLTIMGRTERELLNFAQYIYPPMQAVDIKYLGEDIPHGGMDQRKVHVLAREVYPKLGWKKPVALHHHLLMGLAEPPKVNSEDKIEQVVASKMSKSQPWTAIFIHDSEKQIREKLLKAWCPEKQAEMNPVLELAKYIIFHEKKEFLVERSDKY
jgi:tyrosyl-tRNA synthetase